MVDMEHPSPQANPPVYNCRVYVAPRNEQGVVQARVAQLADVQAEAVSQRAALAAVVAEFKCVLSDCHARGEQPPWLDAPLPIAPGETEFYIAVHL